MKERADETRDTTFSFRSLMSSVQYQGMHSIHLYSTLSTDCYVSRHADIFTNDDLLYISLYIYIAIQVLYVYCSGRRRVLTFLTHGLSTVECRPHHGSTHVTHSAYVVCIQFESRSQRLHTLQYTHFLELRHKETNVTHCIVTSFFRSVNQP